MAPLMMSSYDDDKPLLSFKTFGILFIGLAGVFGTGFLSSFQGLTRDVAIQSSATQSSGKSSSSSSTDLKTNGSQRGSKTRLTRREINDKLSQFPIFYASRDGKGVYADAAKQGYLFESKDLAANYAKKEGGELKVKSTTLNDVYFTLVEKKTKLSVAQGAAGASDPEGSYALVGDEINIKDAGGEVWRGKHKDDIPLFRVPNVAFQKQDGLELPLFGSRKDALNAFERLQESKGLPKGSGDSEMQITSVVDVVNLWKTGGSDSRALELYPTVESLNDYNSLAGTN